MNRPANPLGLGLVIVGAFAMAIAAFLPLDQPIGVLRMVQDNTLIQHGGWLLIALALGVAGGGFRASQGKHSAWVLTLVACVVAAIQIFNWGTDKGLRTLYPVGANGTLDTSQPGMVASLGIAIYVAGAGVAAAFIGVLMLRQTKESLAPDAVDRDAPVQAQTKKCPDCAETILADAKVCKHCGYRFTPSASGAPQKKVQSKPTSPSSAPQTPAPRKSTKVRCHHCQHVQTVPVDQAKFPCEQCKTNLKRRTAPAKSS
jgi:ribosomal protein S27AE